MLGRKRVIERRRERYIQSEETTLFTLDGMLLLLLRFGSSVFPRQGSILVDATEEHEFPKEFLGQNGRATVFYGIDWNLEALGYFVLFFKGS